MRLALLSNVTVDLLAGLLKKEHDVYIPAGFDTWQQELILQSSSLHEYKPEAIIILLHVDINAWSGWNGKGGSEGTDEAEKAEVAHQIIDSIDEWCASFETVCKKLPAVPVFISSIDVSSSKSRYGAEKDWDRYIENYFTEKVQSLHDNGFNIYIIPVKELITDLGRNSFYSPKMWYYGSMPYSMKGLTALSKLINNYVDAIKGKQRKCLVVDLDNTLWGGVIGEEGLQGIVLSSHKEGAVYKDTQRLIKKMKDQGVMLAILSKNNPEDIEPVFSHPDMILQHEDFVAEIINWNPKTKNIRELAQNLNIGLDSFVYLDDNPAEREQMKAECPEVVTIDFPSDSSLLPAVLSQVYDDYFLSLEITREDTQKTAMYKADVQRKAEMNVAPTASSDEYNEYLKKLKMKINIHKMLPEEENRVIQLINKTNQFNTTTKRYSEVASLLTAGADIITVHVSDKYGDQGLIAVLILTYNSNSDSHNNNDVEEACANVDTFLMSCRVMGRNVEFEIMTAVKNYLYKKGIIQIKGQYIKTNKNAPVADLFDRLGFTIVAEQETEKLYISSIEQLPKTTGVFNEVSISL